MIDFAQNSIFKLKPLEEKHLQKNVTKLYIPGEITIGAFKTVRDQVIFTNKRIITVDIQGIGMQKDFFSMPYANIQYFNVQTADLVELIPDCELTLYFSNEAKITFEFRGNCDIVAIGRAISEYILIK